MHSLSGMKEIVYEYRNMKIASIIVCLVIGLFTVWTYQVNSVPQLLPVSSPAATIGHRWDDRISLERRAKCNHGSKEVCHSTNKSLVATFWGSRSVDKWISANILSAFPSHSFDHMVFVYDNSSWHMHPGYQQMIWIHIDGQHRFWYLKRFVPPAVLKAYDFLWIIDDDAKLHFRPSAYQCVIQNLSIPLSAPGRLSGPLSHGITRRNYDFKDRIGRWVDFVETGPIAVVSSSAWHCVYMYLDASTGTGWGLDMIWCNAIAQQCLSSAERQRACAIIDAFGVHHESTSMYSNEAGLPELSVYTQAHKTLLTQRRNIGPLAEDDKLVAFCRGNLF